MDTGGIGKDLTYLAGLLIGVALIALLVGHAGQTVGLIRAGTSGFNSLLQTVTLQNGIGGLGSSMGLSSYSYGLEYAGLTSPTTLGA